MINIFESQRRIARDLGRSGKASESLHLYFRCLALNPSDTESVHFTGVLLSELKSSEVGLSWVQRSLVLPESAYIYQLNFGIMLQKANRVSESLAFLRDLIKSRQGTYTAYLHLGHALRETKRHQEAVDSYERAIALDPTSYPPYEHLSHCYEYPACLDQRRWVLERAHVLCPASDDVAFGLGLYDLLSGEFARGWDLFERRWGASHIRDDLCFSKPLETKRPLFLPDAPNGRVLVWSEQGVGDEVMFGSLLEEFSKKFNVDLLVQLDPRLVPAFKRSFPKFDFVARGSPISEADFSSHIPAGSLPRYLRRSLDSFAGGVGAFLSPSLTRYQEVKDRLAGSKKPIIGISWHTKNGDTRCIPLSNLVLLLRKFDVELVSLQYGDHSAEITQIEAIRKEPIFIDSGVDCFGDIDGVLALISRCDLVISIGNATVHFAGALGVQTVALLPFFPGWRWLSEAESSLWYRSVTLLRQDAVGRWEAALGNLEAQLGKRFPLRK
jgi:tetratricopeptide (TPR) repeat protein